MRPHLPYLRRAVLTYLHSKVLYKIRHEVAIVFFGTRGTSNLVHDDAVAADPANINEYTNIVTLEKMHKPTLTTLTSFDQVMSKLTENSAGGGGGGSGAPIAADFAEALIVAWDLMSRSFSENNERIKYPTKRIIILSNFRTQTNESLDGGGLLFDDGTGSGFSTSLLANNVSLEVISLDLPSEDGDPTVSASKQHNNDILDQLSTQINMKMHSVGYPADLAGVFPLQEHTVHQSYASTDLCLGEKLKIAVKLSLKTKQERLPTLGKKSPLTRGGEGSSGGGGGGGGSGEADADGDEADNEGGAGGALPGIKRSVEWYREDDKDQLDPVPPEDMVKAYRVSINFFF
jgi:hypothetical protein